MTSLTYGDMTVEFAETGPRITGLRFRGGANLFAEIPDAVIEWAGGPPYRLLGGHRLWRAPEVPEVTYRPDDEPVVIVRDGATVRARGAPDPDGLIKEIEATVTTAGTVVVDHRFVNAGRLPVEVAPWTITQFPPDGMAVMPVAGDPGVEGIHRADRGVVLWPYTDPGAAGFRWTRHGVIMTGGDGSRQKIGTENRAGWLAYHRGSHLFTKWAALHHSDARYVDRGASVQVYRDHRFIELETLGPIGVVDPSAAIVHRETWRVIETDMVEGDDVAQQVADLAAVSSLEH